MVAAVQLVEDLREAIQRLVSPLQGHCAEAIGFAAVYREFPKPVKQRAGGGGGAQPNDGDGGSNSLVQGF